MKEIYLSNLSLRKTAKTADEEGEAIKALSKGVKNYRLCFGEFIDAVETQANITEAKQALDSASKEVQSLAEGIAQRQKQAFATISGQAQTTRNSVGDAFAAATDSMTLKTTFLELHAEEKEFFHRRDARLGTQRAKNCQRQR